MAACLAAAHLAASPRLLLGLRALSSGRKQPFFYDLGVCRTQGGLGGSGCFTFESRGPGKLYPAGGDGGMGQLQ